jgi:hypothetical protein
VTKQDLKELLIPFLEKIEKYKEDKIEKMRRLKEEFEG